MLLKRKFANLDKNQLEILSLFLSNMKDQKQKAIFLATIKSSTSVIVETYDSNVWYIMCFGAKSQLFEMSFKYETLQTAGGIEKYTAMSKQDISILLKS